jgi:uncharacterized repeat protein (TIGR01451 family)
MPEYIILERDMRISHASRRPEKYIFSVTDQSRRRDAMKRYPELLSIILLICAALAIPVMASAEVIANLTARKVVSAPGGGPAYQPADQASPGDVIEYQAVYTNQGKSLVKNLVPTMPIPSGMEYIPGSAKPAQVMASLDGKKFEAVPLKRMVTLPNGKQELREVPYEEYRFVRWTGGDMTAGSSTMVSARTKMSDVGSTKPAANESASTGMTAKKGGKS